MKKFGKFLKYIFLSEKLKEEEKMPKRMYAIIFVLPFKEICLRLELSSPPCFRIQVPRYPEPNGQTEKGRMKEILVSYIG